MSAAACVCVCVCVCECAACVRLHVCAAGAAGVLLYICVPQECCCILCAAGMLLHRWVLMHVCVLHFSYQIRVEEIFMNNSR